MTFSLFIQSLAQQALMALGIVPWPDSGEIKKNYDQAKELISMLEMLQEKSKGNLSKEEENLLNGLLYELRVSYIQAIKAS
jgi:hypothetical protein